MDGSPALLLLLALGLCCPEIHGLMRISYRNSISQLRVGHWLELQCQTDKRDYGVFWVHQDKNGTLHFIVFISSLSQVTFKGNQRTSTRFEASKDNTIYRLVVKSFTQQDEGNYFCLMNINQRLYFGPGQPAFLPVTTTPGLITQHSITEKDPCIKTPDPVTITVAPSTPGPTTQRGITEKDPCLKTLDPETTVQEELNSFCHTFIWVPLTGLCLLILQLLGITIVLCQRKTHRNPL